MSIEGLRVAGSTLGLAALFGLFAWREGEEPVFRKGSRIGTYGGRKLSRKEVSTLDNRNRCYLLVTETNNITYTDGSSTSAGVCRYINDSGDDNRNNAEFRFEVPVPYAAPCSTLKNDKYREIIIVALRDIFHGEEIFMSYGNEKFIPRIAQPCLDFRLSVGTKIRTRTE